MHYISDHGRSRIRDQHWGEETVVAITKLSKGFDPDYPFK